MALTRQLPKERFPDIDDCCLMNIWCKHSGCPKWKKFDCDKRLQSSLSK